MTLRRTIAAALRAAIAPHATLMVAEACAAITLVSTPSFVEPARMLLAASNRRARYVAAVCRLITWLDPHPHAQPGAAGLDPDRARVEPAAPAGARVVGGEQAARPAAADAKGGQEREVSAEPDVCESPEGWTVRVHGPGPGAGLYACHRAPGPVRESAHTDDITDPIGRVWTRKQAVALALKRACEVDDEYARTGYRPGDWRVVKGGWA